MRKHFRSPAHLADAALILEVKALAHGERQATARLLVSLAELDARKLYLREGFSSLFTYCTQCLHLSEHAAYNRIEAARAARRWPEIHDRLADGSLTLTSVRMLAPHLTSENLGRVLDSARHKSKREVEQIVAALHPQPDVPATIRKLLAAKTPVVVRPVVISTPATAVSRPATHLHVAASPVATSAPVAGIPLSPSTAAPLFVATVVAASAPSRPAVVVPLAPERYKVQFTIGQETHDRLRRAQDLLRHSVPSGDPAEIFDRAITLLVTELEKAKLATTDRPRHPRESPTNSRHIPAAVKRTVWERDGGRCGFVGSEGRCAERGFLEYHHVVPYARGGAASEENVQLRCRAHNQYEAERIFGPRPMVSGQAMLFPSPTHP